MEFVAACKHYISNDNDESVTWPPSNPECRIYESTDNQSITLG
ncbi:uncharacterized protein G2W53_026593 [Senna tora]|uniref:Uncharacterized protein n=1 Tax=Senna tora TaxID=362788 RepID=A0A834TFC6_9FABA|nr:uncharacterized protein G2W53_026593 [Senna tora]